MIAGCDCAVVGAGPAGGATALLLARAGADVALVDRCFFPRPKACGEGILPSGVEALAALGLGPEVSAVGRPFFGVRYVSRAGRRAEGRFTDGHGLAAPREALDALLVSRAAAAGARIVDGSAVVALKPDNDGVTLRLRSEGAERELRARVLVAADGPASPSLRMLGVDRRPAARRRFGVSARFEGFEGLEDVVEVHLLANGELYLTPLPGPARVNVAALFDAPWRAAPLTALLASCPALAGRALRARPAAPARGLGPLGGSARLWEGERWVAVGDAAGAVDPLVGDGIGLAVRGARLAADAVLERLAGRARPGSYTARRRRLVLSKTLLAQGALSLTRRPSAAEAAIGALARWPALFGALLSV